MANNGLQGQGLFTPGFGCIKNKQGTLTEPRVFSESDKNRLVDAELVVPPPYQISKGEAISCVTVFKMLKPNPEHWRADESFVTLTFNNPEEDNDWNLVMPHQQPSEWRFRVRFLPDDPENMYVLVDNTRFLAAGKVKLWFKVFVRTQYNLSPNPFTEEIKLDPIILPDELWPGGKPEVPQKPIYVAGVFQLRESLEVKEEAGVERQNPLCKSTDSELRATFLLL